MAWLTDGELLHWSLGKVDSETIKAEAGVAWCGKRRRLLAFPSDHQLKARCQRCLSMRA